MLRKYISVVALVALGLFSCDPMEDLNSEIEKDMKQEIQDGVDEMEANKDKVEVPADGELILNADDYAKIGGSVSDNLMFDKDNSAESLLPGFFTQSFLNPELGTSVVVSYNYFEDANELAIADPVTYEVQPDEYNNKYNNFDKSGALGFVQSKYTDAKKGDLVELIFDLYDGGFYPAAVRYFVHIGEGGWIMATELSSDDYSNMGQRYPNFENDDMALERIKIYMPQIGANLYSKQGDRQVVRYTFTEKVEDERIFESRFLYLENESTYEWIEVPTEVEKSIELSFNGDTWDALTVEIVKYTMTRDDYNNVGSSNAAQYGNFNLSGDFKERSAIIKAVGGILDATFGDEIKEGVYYLVKYDYYNGSVASDNITLQKVGKDWVEVE
ncbi:hypothetical protein [Aureibacter tunicatorum]|uniref:Uncharacterized protein n=1 Tax=Aureibacter tunicatorum TaxID=866807 RepID=A0AAE3XJE6_9BACT|nr:hypothetical protein [Aureibacter tunicatorum]MDR6237045.1 hypothetical protein [Aureibacter tunicatorum]BDD06037.1 hypothetical protein AUTU_35200 [Aureibacter tunicatorum]